MLSTVIASTLFLWLVLFGPAVFFGPDDEPYTEEDEAWFDLMAEVDREHESEWGPHGAA